MTEFLVRFITYVAILVALGAVIFRMLVVRRAGVSSDAEHNASRRAAHTAQIAAIVVLPMLLLRLVF